jgi:hypothetical protein
MSNPALFPRLRGVGLDNMIFQMSAFSSRYHYPVEPNGRPRDLTFVGSPGGHGQRAAFLSRLAEKHDVDVFGVGWEAHRGLHPRLRIHRPIGNRGFRQLCADSKIVLGMNEVNSAEGYFSNRTWLTLGCRGFHLTHYVPGIEEVFERGRHLDWFEDVEEAMSLVDSYLGREGDRRRIAEAGFRFAVERHQYADRVAEVLRALNGAAGPRETRQPGPASFALGYEVAEKARLAE